MATIRFLLGIICLIAFKQLAGAERGTLGVKRKLIAGEQSRAIQAEGLLKIARAELGVREATGKNDGRQVEAYLATTGLKKGNPWCAAFISWVFNKSGAHVPCTPWSPALFPKNRLTKNIKPACVFGIYSPGLNRIAHCGFVESSVNHWIISIEGNTNVAGGREGDGVYRKRRHSRAIKFYADWLDQKGGVK